MGEAKRRGTYAQRVAGAEARRIAAQDREVRRRFALARATPVREKSTIARLLRKT